MFNIAMDDKKFIILEVLLKEEENHLTVSSIGINVSILCW